MEVPETLKDNISVLAGRIYTFNTNIEPTKRHNMYYGINDCPTGYSKYNISEMSNIACEKYIVENKLLRKEGDARSVEIRFDFSEFYLIINRQSFIYPNHHVGKTILILPKSRYINGFKSHSCYETLVNYFHKYLNEEYTNYDVYPLEMLQNKIFDFKNQKYYPLVIFNYNGIEYQDYLYPSLYRVKTNNKYNVYDPRFKDDVKNMVFNLAFEIYADIKTLHIEITYKLGRIIGINTSYNLDIKSIHFNHFYYKGSDFEIGRYNFHSSVEFESEILRQIYRYYRSKIDFNTEFLLNRLKYRKEHTGIIRKIIYTKPAVKLFILAVMTERDNLAYPLLNTLVVRKILEEFF